MKLYSRMLFVVVLTFGIFQTSSFAAGKCNCDCNYDAPGTNGGSWPIFTSLDRDTEAGAGMDQDSDGNCPTSCSGYIADSVGGSNEYSAGTTNCKKINKFSYEDTEAAVE